MDEVETAKEKLLEKLRSIQTKEELEENIDDIKDLSEGVILAAIGKLEKIFEDGLPTDQVKMNMELSKFQDESYIFDPEMDKEMQRIAEIPGAEDLVDDFDDEMEKRVEPHLERFGELMMKLMEKAMGGIMGGMAEAMGGMAEGMQSMAEDMKEKVEGIEDITFYSPPKEVGELTYGLTSFLNIQSVKGLNEEKDAMFNYIDDLFKDKFENIRTMFEIQDDRGEIGDELKKLMRSRTVTNEEVGKLFDRLEEKTGDKGSIDPVRDEFSQRMEPIEGQIKDLKREFIQNR